MRYIRVLLYPRNEPICGGWEMNERGNQISEMARLMRTEKKKLAVDFSEVRLRPETWETGGLENHQECWRKFKICQIWSNTAAKGLFTGHFLRKIPDVEQHRCYGTVYGSIRSEQEVNTFQIWSNTPTIFELIRSQDSIIPIWKHRCYGTVYGSNRFMLCMITICLFLRCLHPVTLGIAFI